MKRNITMLFILFLFMSKISGQPEIRGIIQCYFSNYITGDTVMIKGYTYNKNNHTGKYLIKTGKQNTYLPSSCIKVCEDDYGFWTRVWFTNRMYAITKDGWQGENREMLNDDFSYYISSMEGKNLIYRDDYLENYLHTILLAIHPECLIKPVETEIEIILLNLTDPEIYAFNNGTIVISTGEIARISSEEELALILSESIAHIVLEDDLVNLNKSVNVRIAASISAGIFSLASDIAGSILNVNGEYSFFPDALLLVSDMSSLIADSPVQLNADKYSETQLNRSGRIARECIDNLISENYTFRSCQEYGMIISSVIRDCAWNEYFRGNYETSDDLIDKLINSGISDEEDWLLKTKNLLALKNDNESNLLALEYIEAAQQIDQYHLAEVLMVKGIILMRLERTEEAREVLNEFVEVSEYAGIDSSQIEEARTLISDCNLLLMNR